MGQILEEVRNTVLVHYELALENDVPLNERLFGAALGCVNDLVGEDGRHEFQMAVFGVYSATQLDVAQKVAYLMFVGPAKNPVTGRWEAAADVREKIKQAVAEWREEVGRMQDGLFDWEMEEVES